MIYQASFSKPTKDIQNILGKDYIKARILKNADSALSASSASKEKTQYKAEFFTQKQAFQQNMTEAQVEQFIKDHAGTTFKNAVIRTDTEEITYMANRRGEIKKLVKNVQGKAFTGKQAGNKNKNYIIKEGIPVPFLIKLGVMTKDGKIISQKYDKFRQINRFLEFIDDILPELTKICTGDKGFTEERPLHIADFGCGKSYLTFAVYHFLNELKGIPVEITGLDLKEDVIRDCQNLANEFGYKNLHFYIGDIAQFSYSTSPDVIITLHACDTATDYALNYAITHNSAAILSVPCCQHEINLQLDKTRQTFEENSPFNTLTRYGIIKERFAALATDALRAELLEQQGYAVQMLEFIDMEGTPKNLLIRAIKKQNISDKSIENSKIRTNSLLEELGVSQTLLKLLNQ